MFKYTYLYYSVFTSDLNVIKIFVRAKVSFMKRHFYKTYNNKVFIYSYRYEIGTLTPQLVSHSIKNANIFTSTYHPSSSKF